MLNEVKSAGKSVEMSDGTDHSRGGRGVVGGWSHREEVMDCHMSKLPQFMTINFHIC